MDRYQGELPSDLALAAESLLLTLLPPQSAAALGGFRSNRRSMAREHFLVC